MIHGEDPTGANPELSEPNIKVLVQRPSDKPPKHLHIPQCRCDIKSDLLGGVTLILERKFRHCCSKKRGLKYKSLKMMNVAIYQK